MNDAQELERFKRDINIAHYAAANGYSLDRQQSSRNSYVMQGNDGDKIVISTALSGHGVYFSIKDSTDHGSIIDFVMRRRNCSLGAARQCLRSWTNAPSTPTYIVRLPKPFPVTKDKETVLNSLQVMESGGNHPYLARRGISKDTLRDPRFVSAIKMDSKGNAVFPHYDRDGICGYEIKNHEFTGFARGGEKGLWFSSNIKYAAKIVVVESAIDALSHAQLTSDRDVAYLSIGGALSPKQVDLLQRFFTHAHSKEAQVTIGTDTDSAGEQFAKEMRKLAPDGMDIKRQTPEHGKDWNDLLCQKSQSRTAEPEI